MTEFLLLGAFLWTAAAGTLGVGLVVYQSNSAWRPARYVCYALAAYLYVVGARCLWIDYWLNWPLFGADR